MNAIDIVQDELYRHLSPLKGEFERKDAKGLAPMFQRGLQIRVQQTVLSGKKKVPPRVTFVSLLDIFRFGHFFYFTTLELE